MTDSEVFDGVIEEIRTDFSDRPFHYRDESTVKNELYYRLRSKLEVLSLETEFDPSFSNDNPDIRKMIDVAEKEENELRTELGRDITEPEFKQIPNYKDPTKADIDEAKEELEELVKKALQIKKSDNREKYEDASKYQEAVSYLDEFEDFLDEFIKTEGGYKVPQQARPFLKSKELLSAKSMMDY